MANGHENEVNRLLTRPWHALYVVVRLDTTNTFEKTYCLKIFTALAWKVEPRFPFHPKPMSFAVKYVVFKQE
jgi:hypothetical protein